MLKIIKERAKKVNRFFFALVYIYNNLYAFVVFYIHLAVISFRGFPNIFLRAIN